MTRLTGSFLTCVFVGVLIFGLPTNARAAIVSDDFDMATLDTGVWTVVDPVGDGTVGITGAGTADAQLLLSVPQGTDHDAWRFGNNSLRVMQDVSDEDFEIEVKFESVPSQTYQDQGLLIEEDAEHFFRVDFYRNNLGGVCNGLCVFVAYVDAVNQEAPPLFASPIATNATTLYLRLTRQGDQWTPEYSYDGTSWNSTGTFTQALTVSAVGVYAANHDPNPAYTAVVDYFFNTSDPIEPEDGRLRAPRGATVPILLDLLN